MRGIAFLPQPAGRKWLGQVRPCPLWVKSGHWGTSEQCPLYPQKRTLISTVVMSALCQKRTLRSATSVSAKCQIQKSRPSLRTPGAPKILRCLCGSLERCVSILCAHSDSRFDVRQTTAAGGRQDRGSRRFLVREFTNRHPIMVAEGQVPPDEPTSNTLEEFSNRFLTIFWLCQHTFDSG